MQQSTHQDPPLLLCQVSGKKVSHKEAMHADVIRQSILDFILARHPEFDPKGYISIQELNRYRKLYAQTLLSIKDHAHISEADQQVLQSINQDELISESPDAADSASDSLGDRLADRIASFGGSWKFIILFSVIIIVWMTINSLMGKAFDPYPFILLNLVLSCLAALQAPVIMMSQNRQEAKDRLRALNDYKINVKAEIEVRQLQDKLDLVLLELSQIKKS